MTLLNRPSGAKLTPTDEQLAIIDATGREASLMVQAYAGCAKSSTLELAAPRVRVPALALAFNKSIALELRKRLPGNFSTATMNSQGFWAWQRANPHVSNWTVDGNKMGKLLTQVAKEWERVLDSDLWDLGRELLRRVQGAGIVPGGAPGQLAEDTQANWLDLADEVGLSLEEFDFLYDLCREVLERSNAQASQGLISFDDQIYCPVCLGGKWPRFPWVFVDEAQDLSPLNHAILGKVLLPSGKLLACGDPLQAIYSFRGAHTESMAQIEELRPEWRHLGLRTTFRCPKIVVARQQDHAPGFQAWSGNAEGAFARLPIYEELLDSGGWTWRDIDPTPLGPNARSAVLCRNNAPLLGLAFKLIHCGIAPVMLGRDLGKGLLALSRKICKEDSTPAAQVAGLVQAWREHEISLALVNGREEKIAGIDDRTACLQAVLAGSGATDAKGLRRAIERIFSREEGAVTLGSGHKAKGLEWDLVLHLDPWRLPSKQARQALKAGDPRPMRQERNLKYVIETRTRNVLKEASLQDFRGRN